LPTEEFPPDFGLYDGPSRGHRGLLFALFGFCSTVFILGGLVAGYIFLGNWKVLASRTPPQARYIQIPGTIVEIRVPDAPSLPPLLTQKPPEDGPADQPKLSLPPLPIWTDPNPINVLLLGIDHRDDEPIDGSRSDTMMFVSVNPKAHSAVMVSIPRDTWVSIPGYGEQRINVAHFLGGPELAKRTVAANFGVKVDHYARIDFRGFEQIVDTLGGIFVDVERPVKDDEYPTEDYGVMRIYIPPGPQWMDGHTALQYARSRHSEDDFGRARRQQRTLLAILERAVQANMILKAPELVPLAQKAVSTDFGALDLIKLAGLSSQIDRERVVNLVLDTSYVSPYVTPDGADVLIPNRPAIQGAIQQALNRSAALPTPTAGVAPTVAPTVAPPTATPTPSAPVRLEVLNGTTRAGLAQNTADLLRQKGYAIARVDNADSTDYPESRLLTKPGREAAAQALASALGLPSTAVQPAPSASSAPDIRLILGRNFQLPTAR
jgi:polyisoprenyl-teichoic acid--peptidoglycan teichoic acid transferase